jgi:hypothetical protein
MLADPQMLPSFRALTRRALPQVLEASIVPAVILLLFLHVVGATVAIVAALGWVLASTAVRVAWRRHVSGLTILSITRLFVRSVIAIAAGSTFLYFVQGPIGGLCLGLAWLVSVAIDRPLARRFVKDFCDLAPHVLDHPRVRSTLRRISVMWGLVGLAHAALGFWLLLTLSVSPYVVVNAVLSVVVPAAVLALSVAWFRRDVTACAVVPR